MPRFAANLTMMFTEHEPLERLQAARDAGFGAVEMVLVYDFDAGDLAAATAKAGVVWSVINFPTGRNFARGPLVSATPGLEAEFDEVIGVVKRYAEALRPAAVVMPAATPPEEIERDAAMTAFVSSLRRAGEALAEIGTPLIIEALSPELWPGAMLSTTAQVNEALARIDHPNVGIEYDVFHMYATEGPEIVPIIESVLPRLGNVQFADVPGRNEPGSGTIDFAALFDALDDMGYDKWTAAEYRPSGATLDSLGWLKPYL